MILEETPKQKLLDRRLAANLLDRAKLFDSIMISIDLIVNQGFKSSRNLLYPLSCGNFGTCQRINGIAHRRHGTMVQLVNGKTIEVNVRRANRVPKNICRD
jgi:hypothetical protein